MKHSELCTKMNKMILAMYRKAFRENLDQLLEARGVELTILGLDTKQRKYIDFCRSTNPAILQASQSKGYIDADAGYLANAHIKLGVPNQQFDLFLINLEHTAKTPDFLEPIIVHELAHMLDHINREPTVEGNDEHNADAIMEALHPSVVELHSRRWALHLAGAGRRLIERNHTQYKTIRSFLEAAIPEYDRVGPVKAKKG